MQIVKNSVKNQASILLFTKDAILDSSNNFASLLHKFFNNLDSILENIRKDSESFMNKGVILSDYDKFISFNLSLYILLL